MWERFAKSRGKRKEAPDEALSSGARSLQRGYLFMQWGAGLEKSFPKDVDAKRLWKLKRRHGQGLRREIYSVLQIDKPHQAQEPPWSRHSPGLGQYSHAVSHSGALFPLFLATFLWQHVVAGLWARDIIGWTRMTLHTQVPLCNLGIWISMWLLVCIFICSICAVN